MLLCIAAKEGAKVMCITQPIKGGIALTHRENRAMISAHWKGGGNVGKTSNESKDKWKAANYTRVNIYLTKEDAAAYKAKCAEQGKSMSDIPKEAILKFLAE